MRRAAGPLTRTDVETIAAFRAALDQAGAGLAALSEAWQRLNVTVAPAFKRLTREVLIVEALHRAPRHRDTPHPSDVLGWLELNAAGDLGRLVHGAYREQQGRCVPEVCMRRTRDNGVLPGDVMVRRGALARPYSAARAAMVARRRPFTVAELIARQHDTGVMLAVDGEVLIDGGVDG